jgi:hypothetical protein
MQAAMTAAMVSLDGVSGRSDIMPLALSVTSHDQARFVVLTIHMLAQYHISVNRIQSLKVLGTIIAEGKHDNVIIAAPVDYLSWTQELDKFSAHEEFTDSNTQIHIAGSITDLVKEKFAGLGWSVYTDSKLFKFN